MFKPSLLLATAIVNFTKGEVTLDDLGIEESENKELTKNEHWWLGK